ncbi:MULTISPECIES: peptidoglycan recognition protein family protein [Streptomycetaceae]|uniref:N-acetylmuramoyl-L-alanine amidase n=1 Tax=Streptantibioticus cattleyicolor (strain ATCC 35852 / DSM 46488 / JCM 4925 / NBRC 14057 / NRRL 8057) TaxID=1003195 RepID=F8JV37_STREN|nr:MULTISPECIES: peptidoglycan recognition family protein [Streptomycetaceae]AEW93119.1 hypothetical protein SCATT_07480 [Streptantibioticus cattleyicolor NRRL 8057 = DSM 46488]MYS57848.1 N-acetylmuramoyl-L-alanine amidase [Streptomyces sp. SID5468]CCB73477.1 conserved exported protein of unknown function [Streptantibioticus cattleyicolor NRRL 8057 = DSM 46488]
MAAVAAAALLPVFVGAAPAGAGQADTGSLQRAFTTAARHYHVPVSVLLGVSYLESRWDGHAGRPSVTGGYGPMHLTDARTALAGSGRRAGGDALGDPRGDTSRPLRTPAAVPLPAERALPASLRTAERAAALTGLPRAALRENAADNVAGGAALLAAAQRATGRPPSADPGQWFGAVARYSGADDAATATDFADDVFQVIHDGAARTTDSGQRVALAADASVRPRTTQVRALGLRAPRTERTECPRRVACEWVPAPYQQYGPGNGDYGNHDLADRPKDSSVDYIVIHDTEGTWDTTLKLVQDPKYLGWHYTVRSSDGHVAEHMATKDVGWHAGNWYVNAKSIGIEHEGFLADPDAWYTEAMYRASARLVRYLAARYDIPLDRQHILGHDNVPGTTPATVAGMHTDPGPYWDWAHYFELLGAPFHATAGRHGGLVTIDPSYQDNQPVYTDCAGAGTACAPHGSEAVRLHTAPSEDAPLVRDVGLHGSGESTTGVNDTGARASTGQRFAVADRRGDWVAVWYLGQKAWFHDPAGRRTAVDSRGWVVTPKPGAASVPVYGRAYPEATAYPSGVPVQSLTPLQYTFGAGQSYAVGGRTPGEYFYSQNFDRSGQTWVRGRTLYYEIQFGHRVAYVKADDVVVRPSRG